jgi:hypothetical protein
MTNETSLKIESLPSQSTNLSNHCNLQSQDLIDKRLKVFLIVWTKWQKRVENDSSENVSVMFALYVAVFANANFASPVMNKYALTSSQ